MPLPLFLDKTNLTFPFFFSKSFCSSFPRLKGTFHKHGWARLCSVPSTGQHHTSSLTHLMWTTIEAEHTSGKPMRQRVVGPFFSPYCSIREYWKITVTEAADSMSQQMAPFPGSTNVCNGVGEQTMSSLSVNL